MSHCLNPALLQWQSRLSSIQCLYLTFLVAAQNQRIFWRRHIQPDDIFQLLDKFRVTRDLEGLFQMGLQTQAPPMTTDGGSVNTQLGCRLAGAPMRGSCRFVLRCKIHQALYVHFLWRGSSGQITLYSCQATLGITVAPTRYFHAPDTQCVCDILVAHSFIGHQYNLSPLG